MDLRELSMIVFVLCHVYNKVVAAPVSDSQSNPGLLTNIDGTFLFELGTNVSSPLLRLIGQTFEATEKRFVDTICERHPCAEWESWSTCSVNIGYGMRSRTRDCSSNKKICSNVDTTDLATVESDVCEGGWCPGMYNYTSGFCLKLYNTQMMTQWDAQAACQQDGGHLVNVNTKVKSDVMHTILKSHGITTESIWINGNRTQQAGAWHYTYGSAPNFDNWYSSEPSNATTELCKVDDTSDRLWYDRTCPGKYYFVCELV